MYGERLLNYSPGAGTGFTSYPTAEGALEAFLSHPNETTGLRPGSNL